MFSLLCSLIRLLARPSQVREIALENLALRQQLAVMKRQCPRPRLRATGPLVLGLALMTWPNWRKVLLLVRPETVMGWHRRGFRLFWTWISRKKGSGRPQASPGIRALISKMAA